MQNHSFIQNLCTLFLSIISLSLCQNRDSNSLLKPASYWNKDGEILLPAHESLHVIETLSTLYTVVLYMIMVYIPVNIDCIFWNGRKILYGDMQLVAVSYTVPQIVFGRWWYMSIAHLTLNHSEIDLWKLTVVEGIQGTASFRR